jgi:hypothetical protein
MSVATEEKPQTQAKPQRVVIDTVYLTTRTGTQLFVGEEATDILKEIAIDVKQNLGGDDFDYTFYERGIPVYWAQKTSAISPIIFPLPEQYGMSSPKLYALAKTLPGAIAKLIKLRTQGKPSLLSQLKEAGMLIMPLLATLCIIFLLLVTMRGH